MEYNEPNYKENKNVTKIMSRDINRVHNVRFNII